jgi:predicted nucleic acid-binding Zn ribbon protein
LVSSTNLRQMFRNRNVYSKWAEAAGEELAKQTRVAGLQRGRLTVECSSQVLAAELSAFRKAELIARLKELLGNATIEDIRFIVGGDIG